MKYTIFEQIAELSSVFTLEPGDILATGTPAGIGAAMRPPRYLKPNDRVRIEIDGVGTIDCASSRLCWLNRTSMSMWASPVGTSPFKSNCCGSFMRLLLR
jgi:hypothetical protein